MENDGNRSTQKLFRMDKSVHKLSMHENNQAERDLSYWLTQSPVKRVQAVTFLIRQSLSPGARMDKSFIRKFKMKA